VLLRIAATALEQGLTLVTQNVDDFKGVEGLRILNPFEQGAKG
jgi:predicted nucleic acid-binding protein